MRKVTLSVICFIVGALAVHPASAQNFGGSAGVTIPGGLPGGGLPPGFPFPGGLPPIPSVPMPLPTPLPVPPPADLDPCCHIYTGAGVPQGAAMNFGGN
jgi:hypothetical protein